MMMMMVVVVVVEQHKRPVERWQPLAPAVAAAATRVVDSLALSSSVRGCHVFAHTPSFLRAWAVENMTKKTLLTSNCLHHSRTCYGSRGREKSAIGMRPWGYMHVVLWALWDLQVFLKPSALNDERFLGAAFDELFLETAIFDERFLETTLF